MSVLCAAACEAPPARSKPWRHVADPEPVLPTASRPAVHPEDPARAHTLRIRLEAEPTHLDPLLDIEREGLSVVDDTVFEGLIRHVRPGAYEPGLATSWSVGGDGTEIRLVMRQGVTFHDGHPMSAVDAQFSIDVARSAAGKNTWLRAALADVMTVELYGPRDLRLELRRKNAYVLRALAEVPILPSHIYGGRDLPHNPKNRAPIGTGPYRFVKWQKGDRIQLEAYPGYWGAKPGVPDVEFLIMPDGAKALILAKQGGLDVLPALIPEYAEQPNAPGMKDAFRTVELAPARFRAVVVNARRAPFDDPLVRQAAALLVDRDKIVRDVYRGLARPVSGPIWPGGPGDAQGPSPPAFDPKHAAALLDQAGYKAMPTGIRERAGEKLHIGLLATSDAKGDAERDIIVGALRKAGFAVEIRPGDTAYLMSRLQAGDFDAAMVEYRGRVDEDLAPLYSSKGAWNWGGLSSKTVDAACDAARAAWDPVERAAQVKELGRVLTETTTLLPLVAPTPRGLVARRVQGLAGRDGWFAVRGITLEE